MTYEELNAAHVAELLALGVPPEELEAAPALREVWEEIRHTRNVTPEALAR